MPEDQGVKGDIWNYEAGTLLKALGWQQIGDSNIDVVTESGKKRGIDAIFSFPDLRRNSKYNQAVLVEAKCYDLNNISKSLIQQWVQTLNIKLSELKNSEEFLNTYPRVGTRALKLGVIVIWCSNSSDFPAFKPKFNEMLREIRVPKRSTKHTQNIIHILDNDGILRLASLVQTLKKINDSGNTELLFYYPISENYHNVIERSSVLTLDYIFSKIVLCESTIGDEVHRFVFYFGNLKISSFQRLKSLLSSHSFLDKDKPLSIYCYQRDDDLRKIKPEIKDLFSGVKLTLEEMDIFQVLPTFLRKKDD